MSLCSRTLFYGGQGQQAGKQPQKIISGTDKCKERGKKDSPAPVTPKLPRKFFLSIVSCEQTHENYMAI